MDARADRRPIQRHARVGITRRNSIDNGDIGSRCDCCRCGNIWHAIQVAQQILTGCGGGSSGIELEPPGAAVILGINRRRRGNRRQVDGVSESEFLHLQSCDVDGKCENQHQRRHQQDRVQDALAA